MDPRAFGVSLGTVLWCFDLPMSSGGFLFCDASHCVYCGVSGSRRRFGGGGEIGGSNSSSCPNGVNFPMVGGAVGVGAGASTGGGTKLGG
jgi:hypothetical protein